MNPIPITSETRTLPSKRTFVRHRCPVCKFYWDTEHPLNPNEKEHHAPDCTNKPVMNTRNLWKAEFEACASSYIRICFPTVEEGSRQWVDLRRTFLGGALIVIEMMSRPSESEEHALARAKGIMEMGRDVVAEVDKGIKS